MMTVYVVMVQHWNHEENPGEIAEIFLRETKAMKFVKKMNKNDEQVEYSIVSWDVVL